MLMTTQENTCPFQEADVLLPSCKNPNNFIGMCRVVNEVECMYKEEPTNPLAEHYKDYPEVEPQAEYSSFYY
jgi:hypothetical protein